VVGSHAQTLDTDSSWRRILVVGSGGAGKSTFARNLGRVTGLPVIHLDRYYWRAGWTAPSPEQWHEAVDQLIAGDSWIMDGNYSSTFARRFAVADAVVFLDYPRTLCVARALKRFALSRWAARPDMADGCHERLDIEFLRWIWHFPIRSRPRVMDALSQNRHRVECFRVSHPSALPLVTERIVNRTVGDRTRTDGGEEP
jgi:adenylate kinase family enzyme